MAQQLSPTWTGFQKLDAARGTYKLVQSSFIQAGIDNWTKPPWQSPDLFAQLLNVMPVSRGVLERRWGYNKIGTLTHAAHRFGVFQKDSAGTLQKQLLSLNTTEVEAYNEDGTFYSNVFAPTSGASLPYWETSRNYTYFSDGEQADLYKWDGTSGGGLTAWGTAPGASAITVGSPSSGSVTLSIGRAYYAVFKTSGGNYSDLNPVSVSTGPITSKQVPLSAIPTSSDAQVTTVLLLATADGGDETTLYELDTVSNGTTTYTDDTAEEVLLANNVWQDTDASGNPHGVADNSPPPTPRGIPIQHRGRMYLLDGDTLYFSKNLDDVTTSTGVIAGRWEECWPGTYQMEISKGAEVGKGLYSDGEVLYIGTERTIYRLTGTGPADFAEPETVFTEAGVVSQDVWTPVFRAGQLLGAMWLTPDFRVIQSDFTSYLNVGLPVQTTLQSINQSAVSAIRAAYIGIAPYDMWVLAIPTGSNTICDTLLIYNLQAQSWTLWQPYKAVTALLFNVSLAGVPQFWFSGDDGGSGGSTPFCQFLSSATQDGGSTSYGPVDIPYTIQTSWFTGGDPQLRWALNELEVQTDDPATFVTVDGATTGDDFLTPHNVVTNKSTQIAPWGAYKLWLAGYSTRDRFYRITFHNTTGTGSTLLGYFSMEAVPFNRL